LSTARIRRLAGAALPLAALTACAALGPGPLVQQQDEGLVAANLARVAVVPLASALRDEAGGEAGADAAAEIAGALSEGLAHAGLDVVAPGEVGAALAARGVPVPSADAAAAARAAHEEFGATSVVLGRVTRFRERVGSAAGARVAASVAFEVFVHEAPSGRRLWAGRFDETQPALSANVARARQFPGGGTRWLTAAEVGRWGAGEVARAIATRPEEPAP
jgi:hypothetical protein